MISDDRECIVPSGSVSSARGVRLPILHTVCSVKIQVYKYRVKILLIANCKTRAGTGNINPMVKIIIIAILIYLLLGVVFTALVTDGSRFFVLHYTLIWPFHLFLLVVIFEFCRRWSKNNPNGI